MPHPLVKHCKRDGADVYIGRPSPYGNPFEIGRDGTRSEVIEKFRDWLLANPYMLRMARRDLLGKTLGCWCAPAECHGDVLATYANDSDLVLPPEYTFVFGSNLAGRHGAGAARFAARWLGAERGVGEGITGACYALPTKDEFIQTLPLDAIQGHVAKFLAYAAGRPNEPFQVTRVGCGLSGYDPTQILPFFEQRTPNVHLPWVWERMLDPSKPARVIIAGSRTTPDEAVEPEMNRVQRDTTKFDWKLATVVSGGAKGADRAGEEWAVARKINMIRFPADWKRYGKAAGMIRNQWMAWYASHLVAFWDGQSPGTKSMINMAREDGLTPKRVDIRA